MTPTTFLEVVGTQTKMGADIAEAWPALASNLLKSAPQSQGVSALCTGPECRCSCLSSSHLRPRYQTQNWSLLSACSDLIFTTFFNNALALSVAGKPST